MWILCPASVTKARGRKRGATVYTREGTAVHMMAEALLKEPFQTGVVDVMGPDSLTIEGEEVDVTPEMLQGAVDYVNYVCSLTRPDTILHIEKVVRVSGLAEPLFGTADAIIFHQDSAHLDVVDLKWGQGHAVSPIQNPQQMIYGLGAMEEIGPFVDTVTLHIFQPRAGGVKKWDTTAAELQQWEQDVLVPAALQVAANDPTETVGDHCRWCVRAGECKGLADHSMSLAKTAFDAIPPDPADLSNEYLAKVLDQAEIIAAWVSKVRAEASQRIDVGQDIPNWKLVPKRAMRTWADEDAALDALDAAGIDLNKVTKIRTVAQVERVVGKAFDLKPHVVKESSGTTLARDDDPREGVDTTPQIVFSSN